MEKPTSSHPVSAPSSLPDFSNTERAFSARDTRELLKTYWLYQMIANPFLTRIGPPMLSWALKVGLPVKGLVKSTLFELFCGGESMEESVRTSEKLARFGVKTILDYSVEGEKNIEGFNQTAQVIVQTLEHGGKHTEVAFSACKLTGLAPFGLMERMQAGAPLSEEDLAALGRVAGRLKRIAEAAVANRTPVFLDAEESWIQDTIDGWAEGLMEQYNKEQPWVWTTLQMYRHDRLEYLRGLIRRSREKGYVLGVKLVRGAYMEKERARAREMGYRDPIQPDKAATDRDFDAAVRLCIENIDHVAVCAGTHNEDSSLRLAELMQEKGLAHNDPRIWFAQLLGMSDHISFNLAHHGYNAAKYLPFGPVQSVMPYLIRRAEENTSVAGQSGREVILLAQEKNRRKKNL
jgi:proline dehydrogenase